MRAPFHLPIKVKTMNIEALCAASPEAFAHSPSQMPLSCPVAPPSQRELHQGGGGGGAGGVAMRARAARARKPKSCDASCGTSSATPCAPSFTCPSFMSHKGRRVGGSRPGRRALQHTFFPWKAAFAASFTCSPFTCRPPLSLGLPHQQRASNVQKALGATMKKPLIKKPSGRGDGGSLGQATAVMVMFPPLTDDDPSSAASSMSSDGACPV